MIQAFTGEAQGYQHVALGDVQRGWRRAVAADGGDGGNADKELVNAIFLFQKRAVLEEEEEEVLWRVLDIDADGNGEGAEYPINFEIEQHDETVRLLLSSSSRLIDDAAAWLRRYEDIFNDILLHPNRPVVAFPETLAELPLSPPPSPSPSHSPSPSPSGPVEEFPSEEVDVLRAALSELPASKIEMDTSIFALGIDSISAIGVASKCRKSGLDVSVADILLGRSVRGILRIVRSRRTSHPNPDHNNPMHAQGLDDRVLVSEGAKRAALRICGVDGVGKGEVEEFLPCLPGQVYHLASWLKSGRTLREATFAYTVAEKIDDGKLRAAWEGLRKRYVVLRTVFVATSSTEVVQVVLTPEASNGDGEGDDMSFRCSTLKGEGKEMREGDGVEEYIKAEAAALFDLSTPPARLVLIQDLEGDQSLILLHLHHALYDAWTIEGLVSDLAALYHQQTLPPLQPVNRFVQSTLSALEIAREESRGREDCAALLSFPDPGGWKGEGKVFFLNHEIPSLRALETTCRDVGVSVPTVLLVAFARVLARWVGVGSPIFGIYQMGPSGLAGGGANEVAFPCLNVLPMTVKNVREKGVREVVESVQEDLAERSKYEQSFLQDVVGGGLGVEPLFNTWVNILWHSPSPSLTGSTTPTTADTSDISAAVIDGQGGVDKAEWVPYTPPASSLESLIPTERTDGKTTIDALDTRYLADENVFLDITRNSEGNCVDLILRVDRGALSGEGGMGLLKEVGAEVRRCVEELT
ncbi:putative NRPS-like protein biosynthetic cluster [Bacidia gigantensis]|uniref:putative NRPS-like protein biosynthetic cluster n=1 Tax=Bacidia gigantensis TaxID=2732470 RepID=UPI001D038DC8|nr:putative NRPS-like protein biosynthetic cluster [Bacidia gigantensis]KAG8527808.1 putative NRPS-like protein biosynthetic cluster [Bacidia gigantensis]